jgi:intracellular sulfur oxidation DsrE/DsrF family protein
MWTRRGLALSGFLAACGSSKGPAAAAQAQPPKAVYHLNDLDRVGLVLRSIHNHYAGMAGEPVAIAAVIHGSALRAFHKASASLDVADGLADLVDNGLVAYACSNTLRAQGVTIGDLLAGFDPAECVGVVKLTQLQAQGFAYIKP